MTTPLQKAAQALIQQWDSPGFIVDDEIAELRKALDAEIAQSVEPVTANDDEVICPNCCNQFRAIPIGVQQLMLDAGFEPPFKRQPKVAEPVAYASFADNGNIRIWTKFDTCENVKDLKPLYLHPPQQQAVTTGWDNGLSQDYCKELGQWLASRPGARQQVKEMFEADAQQAKRVPMTDVEIYIVSKKFKATFELVPSREVIACARAIEAHHGIGSAA